MSYLDNLIQEAEKKGFEESAAVLKQLKEQEHDGYELSPQEVTRQICEIIADILADDMKEYISTLLTKKTHTYGGPVLLS